MIVEVILGHALVLTGSVLTGTFPELDAEPTFLENLADLVLENCNFTARTYSNTSIINIGFLQYGLENGRFQVDREFMDECLDCCNLSTGCVVSGGTVSKGDGSVSVVNP